MTRYPTHNGIAVSPLLLDLPDSRYGWDTRKHQSNHHLEYTSRQFGRTAVHQCLRDLERLQLPMPVDVHIWLHDTYDPPKLPTETQAAMEVIDAHEHGERLKRYNRYEKRYDYHDIPEEVVNRFMAKYGIKLCFPGGLAAD